MAGLLVVGCRVQVKTIHFDKNSDHEWSKHEFGNDWETSFCEGTVMQVTKMLVPVGCAGTPMAA